MSSFLAKIAAKALDTCLSLAAEAAEVAVAKGVDAAYHWVTSVKSPPVPVNEESELTANPIVFVDVLAEPISTILVLVEPTAELGPSIDVNVDEEVNEPVAEPLAPSPVTKHDDGECAICRETHVNKSYPPCRHVFCFDCLKRWCLAVNCSMIKCPICRERFNREGVQVFLVGTESFCQESQNLVAQVRYIKFHFDLVTYVSSHYF